MASSKPTSSKPVPKKPRAPKKVLSAADLAAQIVKKEKELEKLRLKQYGTQLDEQVAGFKLKEIFNEKNAEHYTDNKGKVLSPFAYLFYKMREGYDVPDTAILSSIGKAAGVKRLVITQTPPKPQTPEQKEKIKAARAKANSLKQSN